MILDSEKEKGAAYHRSMVGIIAREFPDLKPGQQRYIQNKVSNLIRQFKGDVHEVYLSARPITHGIYVSDENFEFEGLTVYLRFIID